MWRCLSGRRAGLRARGRRVLERHACPQLLADAGKVGSGCCWLLLLLLFFPFFFFTLLLVSLNVLRRDEARIDPRSARRYAHAPRSSLSAPLRPA